MSNGDGSTSIEEGKSTTTIVETEKKPQNLIQYIKSFNSLAWLAFIGDALHNMTDGLAIGAGISIKIEINN